MKRSVLLLFLLMVVPIKEAFSAEKIVKDSITSNNYYTLAPKINQSVWEFLKKYELKDDPLFEQYNSK